MSIANSKPVFFTGQVRSGGTLLTRIFDQSDNLKVAYDTIHYMKFAFKNYHPLEKNYSQLLIEMNERLNKRWELSINIKEIKDTLSKYSKITEAVVYDSIMRSFLKINNNDNIRWGDRTVLSWESINQFLEMFPQGKVIINYRDPRAILASYKHSTYLPEPMYLDVIFSTLALFNYISSLGEVSKSVHLIRYEDLIEKPAFIIKKASQFLEIDYKDEMLNVAQFKDFKGEKFDTDSSFTSQKETIDKSSRDLWREKLSNIEIYFTEMILKNHMLSFGFDLSEINLNQEELNKFKILLNDKYINKRFLYWKKNGNGLESHPDTAGAYN
tara:strand:- start:35 stop:1015 length:981 start_codon:yes stop_codon:yes gene_type:complete